MAYLRGWLAVNLKSVDRVPTLGLINGNLIRTFYGIAKFSYVEAYRILDVDLAYTHGVKKRIKPRSKRRIGVGTFKEFEDEFPYTDLFPIAYRGLILASTHTSDQLWVVKRPFRDYNDLLNYLKYEFEPIRWESRSLEDIIKNYAYSYNRLQEPLKEVTLIAGEVYLTIFTFFLVHLGHRFTLLLLMRNPELLKRQPRNMYH